jgi:hypothetical protein
MRIRIAFRVLRQKQPFLVSVLADAPPVAVQDVMKVLFKEFMMLLLARGNDKSFTRADHDKMDHG